MGKQMHRKSSSLTFDNRGCMSGVFNILDFHQWHNVKKMLPYKRHGASRLSMGSKYSKMDQNTRDTTEADEDSTDGEVNRLLMEEKMSGTSPTSKKSCKAHVKTLIAEEMSKEDDNKHQNSAFPAQQRLLRTDSIHHLEPSNDVYFKDKMDTDSPKKYLDAKDLIKEALFPLSKEFSDVQEIFQANKELFLKILQDPDSSLAYQFQDFQISGAKRELTKSDSFPVAYLSSKNNVRSSKLNHKLWDITSSTRPKGQFHARSSSANLPTTYSSDDKVTQPFPLITDGYEKERIGTAEPVNLSGHSRCSSDELKNQGDHRVATNTFKSIKQRIRYAIRDTHKECRRISMDAIFDRVPYGRKHSKNGKKGVFAHWQELTTDCEYKNSPKSSRSASPVFGLSKGVLHPLRRTASLRESLDKYSKLYESTFSKKSKQDLSCRLKLTNEDAGSHGGPAPKALGRILSLPEYRSLTPLQSEVSHDTFCLGMPSRDSTAGVEISDRKFAIPLVGTKNDSELEPSIESANQEALVEVSSENASQEALVEVSSENASKEALVEASAENASQETLVEVSAEIASQEALVEVSSEIASQEALVEVCAENASQEMLVEVSAENASQDALAEVSSENASQETLVEVGAENVSQETLVEVSSENAGQETSVEVSVENASQEAFVEVSAENANQETLVEVRVENANQEMVEEVSRSNQSQEDHVELKLNPDDIDKKDKLIDDLDNQILLENVSNSHSPQEIEPAPDACIKQALPSPDSVLDSDTSGFIITEEVDSWSKLRTIEFNEVDPFVDLQKPSSVDSPPYANRSMTEIESVKSLSKLFDSNLLHFQVDKKDESNFHYVREVLEVSGFSGKGSLGTWHLPDQPMDPSLCEEVYCFTQESSSCSFDHQLLFDIIGETLIDIYERSFMYWPQPLSINLNVRPMPVGCHVLEEVWASISWLLSYQPKFDHSLDHVVARDLAKADGWMSLQFECECVGLELEDWLWDDLLDEVLLELEES